MINLQNCKSQTPVESYITSSVVRGAPVTPTPAATAASRRAGRPWSCTGDTHTHQCSGQGSGPQPGCSGAPNPWGEQSPKPTLLTAPSRDSFSRVFTLRWLLPAPSLCSSTTKTQLVNLPNFIFSLIPVLLYKNIT